MTGIIILEPIQKSTPGFIIRVDRSVEPSYPEWVKKLMHPELESTGPAEYNLQTEVEQWLHDEQKDAIGATLDIIYDHLKENNALTDCLGLTDLFAIQAKGITLFRTLYMGMGNSVFGWKSVVQSRGGFLCVPYLCERNNSVVMDWSWIGHRWHYRDPALRFRKHT